MTGLSLKVFNEDMIGLAWKFHVSPNSCENHDYYESYLKYYALGDKKKGMGVTHVFLADDGNEICGYVTLRATSLSSAGEDGKHLVAPAIEIAELAVDENYERQKIGTMLLNAAIAFAAELRENSIGVEYVVVCADPDAVQFYERYFDKLSDVYEYLHDGWNNEACVPMYMKLPEE